MFTRSGDKEANVGGPINRECKRKDSPCGKYYAYLEPIDGIIKVWVAKKGDRASASPITNGTNHDVTEFNWNDRSRLVFVQTDDRGVPHIYRYYPDDGSVRCIAERHDHVQMATLLQSIMRGVYNDTERQNEILELLCGWPEIKDPLSLTKIDAQVNFAYYNGLPSEEKEGFLYILSRVYIYVLIRYCILEPEEWEEPLRNYDLLWPVLKEHRLARIRSLNISTVFHMDIPKSLLPRGSRAVSLIQEIILSEFPNRRLASRKEQEIMVLTNTRDAYVFPCKEHGDDILWISYDQYDYTIDGGFGCRDLNMSFSFALPWGTPASSYIVYTFAELELVMKKLCAILKWSHPYHREFFEQIRKFERK